MEHDMRLDPTPVRRPFARWARRLRWQLPFVAVAGVVAALTPLTSSPASHAASAQPEGLVCANGSTAPGGSATPATPGTNPSFVLTARDGYILTPDGNSVYMWGFANGNEAFQNPGPVLCVHEGDTVTVTLRNTLPAATSIVFPGIQGITADGVPSSADLSSGSMTKAATANPASKPNAGLPGGQVTYRFVADHPGTFLYESGTNPQIQVQMGLVGALVVRPTAGDSRVYDDPPKPATAGASDLASFSVFDPKHEYLHVLSEIDPDLHQAIESGAPGYDLMKYKARYFFINGRSFPDTVAPNYSAHVPAQPYGALVHVQPRNTDIASPDYNPFPALVRYLNVGPVSYPFHPHSNQERQIGLDGHELINPTAGTNGSPGDVSQDRFALVVPPGQTMEGTFSWVDAQKWDPKTNQVGVILPDQQARTEGPYWSGSPYLGDHQSLATGVTQYNQCGEMYHVAHSHALFEATNYGLSMGGMLTMIRVDPPNSFAGHANCKSEN
jgi:FtsP/CotA-like multicopper oxidase with cupredoxin domain